MSRRTKAPKVIGDYEILERFAPVGLAELFKARHKAGGPILVLKRMPLSIADDVEFIIGKLAPPNLGFTSHLFPLAFEYIFIHRSSFGSFAKAVPIYAGARGSISRRISSLYFSQVASSSTNARGHRPQAFGHALGRFTFTDKCIRA